MMNHGSKFTIAVHYCLHYCTCISIFLACGAGITCVAANTITETDKCQTGDDTKCICLDGYYGELCQYQRGNIMEHGLAII